MLSCLSFSVAFAQDDTIRIFYDENWKEIADPASAAFRRVAFNNDNGFWQAMDYYRTGQLQMKGVFLDKDLKKRQGPFEFYYEDGKIQSRAMYMNGSQVDDEITYYKNGQVDSHLRYDNSGKQIDAKYYREDGSKSLFVNAEFPGGMTEMYRFIGEKVVYPKSLPRRGIEGRVFISFSVDTNGNLVNIFVFGSPHESMSKEAIRVVKAMPKWKPAQRDQVPLSIKYNLPISFTLN
ncbi:MAG: TonB family protein [Dyadobacter sp.]|uniref:TonB family protein n=1 Tax=Dyadobacter sp. TaxID=1914288 RepID=UPI0032679B88